MFRYFYWQDSALFTLVVPRNILMGVINVSPSRLVVSPQLAAVVAAL